MMQAYEVSDILDSSVKADLVLMMGKTLRETRI